MTDQNQKKLGFFKKLYYSITKFEKYPEMAAEGTASAFKYLVQLMILFSIIVSIGLVIELHETIKKGTDYIQNQLPDFYFNNGILNMDSNEVIRIDSEIPTIDQIIIDTNTDSEDQIDEYLNSIPSDNTGVVLLKDKAIIKAIETNQKVEYSFSEILNNMNFNNDTISKQDIVEYLTEKGVLSIYLMFFVLVIVYVFIIYSISVLVDTLLIAVLGNITVLFTKLKLKFSAVYNMAVYALTLSIILNAIYIAVNSITGFKMSYFQIMYTSIAYVYLVAAIFLIRLDFEKKQTELMEIMKEQEKIRQEMKEEKQDEEKNENKNPEEKDDEIEEKENNEQEDGNEETSGSEA